MLNGTRILPLRFLRPPQTFAAPSITGFLRAAAAANRLQMQPPSNLATQDAVFELLGNPATYRLPAAARIVRHQTHAAIVFLAEDRALKVKHAVRYPFLDFSSLEKRKAACEGRGSRAQGQAARAQVTLRTPMLKWRANKKSS